MNIMQKERFEFRKAKSGVLTGVRIIIDKETGVQYLFAWDGYAGGLTVLLDKDGKPLIDSSVGVNMEI